MRKDIDAEHWFDICLTGVQKWWDFHHSGIVDDNCNISNFFLNLSIKILTLNNYNGSHVIVTLTLKCKTEDETNQVSRLFYSFLVTDVHTVRKSFAPSLSNLLGNLFIWTRAFAPTNNCSSMTEIQGFKIFVEVITWNWNIVYCMQSAPNTYLTCTYFTHLANSRQMNRPMPIIVFVIISGFSQ